MRDSDFIKPVTAENEKLSGACRVLAFAKPEEQIEYKPDKGHGGDQPPKRFFAGRFEIFLGHVDDGPDGA